MFGLNILEAFVAPALTVLAVPEVSRLRVAQTLRDFGSVSAFLMTVLYLLLLLCSSLSTTTPMDQVDSLMVEIGSEAQLNMGEIFAKAGQRIPTALPGAAAAAPAAAARSESHLFSHVSLVVPATPPVSSSPVVASPHV